MGKTLAFLPSCGSPSKTLSFRTTGGELIEDMFVTGDEEPSPSVESVIRGLSTDRFFFNPGTTSSILEEAKPKEKEKERVVDLKIKESVSMMEMESTDPFVDFKKSMQEMMEADEGLKEWENLQELLSLYLAVNDQTNHGYIIGAFVDLLLVNLPTPPSTSSIIINGEEEQSNNLLLESGGKSGNIYNNNNKLMISSESPESSANLSFTSSFASSSGTCSSTSHFLSSCSLEDDEDEDEEEEDNQKAAVSDYPSSSNLGV